jgi:hypothetical protein
MWPLPKQSPMTVTKQSVAAFVNTAHPVVLAENRAGTDKADTGENAERQPHKIENNVTTSESGERPAVPSRRSAWIIEICQANQ